VDSYTFVIRNIVHIPFDPIVQDTPYMILLYLEFRSQPQLAGINTAINSATGQFSGIGFAVSSNLIIREH
jgi:hypothetical protein